VNYLDELNSVQQEAVKYISGPALVIAGAGSGKTRVLTYKIIHLLANNYKPYQILALTFTNKAAREMKERIGVKIGMQKSSQLWMGTFHSIFAKILRFEAEALGYPSSFTIYDTADSKSLIKSIIKDLHLDDKQYPAGDIYGRISKAKNNMVSAAAYLTNSAYQQADIAMKRPEIGKIYQLYVARCKNAGAMDFDDILMQTSMLFANHPEIKQKYQQKFAYILVDEYQDTNQAQYLIIKQLAEQHKRLFIVGDDAQSIYAFRGARIENILNFQAEYPDHKIFKLEQNYRSTQNIVDAAKSIITKNTKQIPKEIFSENESGAKIKVIESVTDNEEGFHIASRVIELIHQHQWSYSDFAILYRTNAQSRIMEEALRKRNIPYKIYGGTSFYQRKEIKDLLAYFKILVNTKDNEALKRIINYPKRGIGDTTIDKIMQIAMQYEVSMWEVIINLSKIKHDLSARTVNAINLFLKQLYQFYTKLNDTDAYKLASEIASATGILKELYNDKSPEGVSRYENIQELLNGIKEMITNQPEESELFTLARYLEDVSLMTNDDNEKEEDKNKVVLMTIHSAKGLEYKNIFVTGLEEGLFPSSMSVMSVQELEEERRLFYVAVTRAEKNLELSYARMRYKWGTLTESVPSRFIKDISPEFIDGNSNYKTLKDTEKELKEQFNATNSNFNSGFKNKYSFNTPANNTKQTFNGSVKSNSDYVLHTSLQTGNIVEHERFGNGKIVAIEGVAPDIKATINFIAVGQKQLLLRFAKLKLVE